MRVLVVEDDPAVSDSLAEVLELQGFSVEVAATGEAALAMTPDADMILLDLGLPDLDGLEVCRRIRANSDVPVILLTAREEEVDRVMGFELGADDYVTKPFSSRELVGRIRAVQRRAATALPAAPETDLPSDLVSMGRLRVDLRAHQVRLQETDVHLTPREYSLLVLLLADPGAVVTREHIMDEVWDTNWFGSTKTLDIHIAALRKKLESHDWIETVRGVGFRFASADPLLAD